MKIKLLLSIFLMVLCISCSTGEIEEITAPDSDTAIVDIPIPVPTEEVSLSEEEKSLKWVQQMQGPNGLLESSENSDFVSLYDNALTSILFIANGELDRAESIFDFFNERIDSELLNGTGGFYQYRNRNGENGGRTWMGDNVWLLMALNKYYDITGSQKYMRLASELEQWIRSLQDDDGGLWGGYNEDGTRIPKVTEGNITAFTAVTGYDDFHKKILRYLEEERWDGATKTFLASPDTPRYNYALDLHSLGFGILESFPESSLLAAERYRTTKTATVTGNKITGYCFDEDKDVVWLEGTAQMAVAFKMARNDLKVAELLIELEKTFITSNSLVDAIGIPYTTNFGSNYGATILWDHTDITPALSSNVWYLFAKGNINPFGPNKKVVPISDKFWVD
ncbi:MAG: hypothetical protein AAFO99_08180 [Bacteroidota bacterium]